MRQSRIGLVVGLVMIGMGSAALAAVSPLEGTSWSVKVVPDEAATQQGEKSFDDGFVFKDGKVTLTACVKAGFAPSTYTAAPAGEAWTLTTEQVSPDQGQTKWEAEISGNAIHGTLVWTKTTGTVLRYTFQGSKEEKTPSAT